MTYAESIQFLYGLRWYGAKLGLDNTYKLAALAGNPHHQLRFIHVAGTNGKGSTCAMIENIYRRSGLRVGLFTSPHLVSFAERIQVNRRLIPESEVAAHVAAIQPWLEEFPAEEHPTFFEVVTILALRYFLQEKCDLVIWETGLGGRLDATNIVRPLASVITNIQYDHQKWLGETLASIAREKAGIVKTGVPVITGADAPEALEVIRQTAKNLNAPLAIVTRAEIHCPPLDTTRVSLLGEHQRMNAAVALATINELQAQFPVSTEIVRTGLETVYWPGRLQLITRPSGQKLLLDGAHNPSGAAMLASALKDIFIGLKPTLVLGILRDKDWPSMCETLAPCATRILLVPVHSERTAEPHGLAEVCARANPAAPVIECSTLAEALQNCSDDPFVTIAGSLYLIGEAMELLHLVANAPVGANERSLNEWAVAGSASR